MEGGYYEVPQMSMVIFKQERIMGHSPLLIFLIYFCFHVIFLLAIAQLQYCILKSHNPAGIACFKES